MKEYLMIWIHCVTIEDRCSLNVRALSPDLFVGDVQERKHLSDVSEQRMERKTSYSLSRLAHDIVTQLEILMMMKMRMRVPWIDIVLQSVDYRRPP